MALDHGTSKHLFKASSGYMSLMRPTCAVPRRTASLVQIWTCGPFVTLASFMNQAVRINIDCSHY